MSLIKQRQKKRDDVAKHVWKIKRNLGKGFARTVLDSYWAVTPLKPSKKNLLAEAAGLLSFAEQPVASAQSEYYSSCGAEDGAYEEREDAREFAADLIEIAGEMV